MTDFTQSALDKLAVFAGGQKRWSHESPGFPSRAEWFFPQLKEQSLWPLIMEEGWHPDSNPAHGDLVLRALVNGNDSGWPLSINFYKTGDGLSIKIGSNMIAFGGNWWPEAVCLEALKVITKGEDDGAPSGSK